MDVTNCLTIRSLAETFDSGDLQWLKKETNHFIRLHFEELRSIPSGMNLSIIIINKKLLIVSKFGINCLSKFMIRIMIRVSM